MDKKAVFLVILFLILCIWLHDIVLHSMFSQNNELFDCVAESITTNSTKYFGALFDKQGCN